jgi:hypothetical protein
MHRLVGCLMASRLTIGVAAMASAQDGWEHARDHGWDHGWERGGWHDRDIHRFSERDLDVWRSGHWHRGRHGGRVGWWWVLGDAWYYYPQPIYPYPDPYLPPVVAPGPPPGQVFDYCPRPRGYYPYVAACSVPWRPVQTW